RVYRRTAFFALLDQTIYDVITLLIAIGIPTLATTSLEKVEWRFRQIQIAAIYDVLHVPEKERQQQCTNVAAVNIGIRHNNDSVVAQAVHAELLLDTNP